MLPFSDDLDIQLLINLLGTKDIATSVDAALLLLKMRERAVLPLIAALPDWRVRPQAISILDSLGDSRAIQPLLRFLDKNVDEDSRHHAAIALGRLKAEQALEQLITILGDESDNDYVRHAAASALGDIGDEQAVVPLIHVLTDQDWELRREAVISLGQLGDQRVAGPLLSLLKDPYPEVRYEVVRVLCDIGDERTLPILEWMAEYDKGETVDNFKMQTILHEAIRRIKVRLEC